MEEAHQLAKDYLQTKSSKDEQRRRIDYDFAKQLKEIENDNTTDGKLKVLHFKSQIQAEEAYYEELSGELKEINNELLPILKQINANRLDPLVIHVEDRTYFDTYLDETGDIISPGLYTKIS